MSDAREPLRILVFSASLRADSLNARLARLAAAAIERHERTVDVGSMRDFDAPSYDADVEATDAMPPGARGAPRATGGVQRVRDLFAGVQRIDARRAEEHEHLGARVHPDMFSLAQTHNAFDDSGDIADERLRARFDDTIANFLDLVEASTHYPCVKRAWVEFLGETPDPHVDRVEL